MSKRNYSGAFNCFARIAREEGYRAFFKVFTPDCSYSLVNCVNCCLGNGRQLSRGGRDCNPGADFVVAIAGATAIGPNRLNHMFCAPRTTQHLTRTHLQFVVYENLRARAIAQDAGASAAAGIAPSVAFPAPPSGSSVFAAAAFAKFLACVVTYPHEVLRTRLREQHSSEYANSFAALAIRSRFLLAPQTLPRPRSLHKDNHSGGGLSRPLLRPGRASRSCGTKQRHHVFCIRGMRQQQRLGKQ